MFCLLAPLFVAAVTIFCAARVGWKALAQRAEQPPERHFALTMIGVNLWEPAVNALLIPALLLLDRSLPELMEARLPVWTLLAPVSMPMAALLLPLVGRSSRDSWSARICLGLAAGGLARWLMTLWTLSAGDSAIWLMLAGSALLWGCIGWAERALSEADPAPEQEGWPVMPVHIQPLIDPDAQKRRKR